MNGSEEVVSSEFRPQPVCEVQLAVGKLPQEKIGDPEFTRCANHQVGIWHLDVVEMAADRLLGDLVRVHSGAGNGTNRVDNLGSSSIVERDRESEFSVAFGEFGGLVHPLDQPLGHTPISAADKTDPHSSLVKFVAAAKKNLLIEIDQELDFVAGPSPILGRERIDRQPLHSRFQTTVDDIEQGILTGTMALGTGQTASLGPAPIAIHHARDVGRDPIGVEIVELHEVETTLLSHDRRGWRPHSLHHLSLATESLQTLDAITPLLPGGGERREGQRNMTVSVAAAIESGGHAVVQAGTGTGKSLAYLVPAVLSGKQTVIATATKALQDQLANKDLPFLSDNVDHDFDFAVLKGRSNYLCLQKLAEADPDNRLDIPDTDDSLDLTTLDLLREFAAETDAGDRAELAEIDDRTWRMVSVGRDECPGASRCPAGDDCLAELARQRAAAADILVVNLHLYAIAAMIDGVLPDHEVVIVDEAHQLEDIVAQAAGCSVSGGRLKALARTAAGLITDRDSTGDIEAAATLLSAAIEPLVGKRLPDGPTDEVARVLDLLGIRVEKLLQALKAVPDDAPLDVATRAIRVRQSATTLLDDLHMLRQPTANDVTWVDGPPHNPSLRSTPILIDSLLDDRVWSRRSGILTSATLASTVRTKLGMPESADRTNVGSPFDYAENALLYCPTDLPDPRSPDSRQAKLDELESLILAAGGRTLALFTSWAAMRDAVEYLKPRMPWNLLTQGQGSKAKLLEEFVTDPQTSLFATMSFWQGVDAPGDTCTLVTIDRLPFPRPDDPVLQARRERAAGAAFRSIDLPRAATMLAQGAGRLIRSTQDRGVVAVLDPRLATARSYRWELIESLPPMRRTSERDEAHQFLKQLRDANPVTG